MTETAANTVSQDVLEAVLREELERGDRAVDTVVPVLRHLLANESNSLFSDQVMAGVRGMLGDVASQLLDKLHIVSGCEGKAEHEQADIAALCDSFIQHAAFVGHLHALALEWQLTSQLQRKLSLDPVLTPLIQALIASQDEATSSLAMRLLAAQARFVQHQQRMQLPLCELPGDLLHSALVCLRTIAGADAEADEVAAEAEKAIRAGYDESGTRLALLARVVEGMGGGAMAALSLAHAGAAIFLTALSIGSGQDRDAAVMATSEEQLARFSLALRAAGVKMPGIEEQLLILHPDASLPEGFERLSSDRAAAILSIANYQGG